MQQIPYLVTLTGSPDFPPTTRIAAEVRYAKALEDICVETGGVVNTFRDAPAGHWEAALRAAEAGTWDVFEKPAGAAFEVRVNAPVREFFIPDDVPF